MTTKCENPRRWRFSLQELFGFLAIAALAAAFSREFGVPGATMLIGMYAALWIGLSTRQHPWLALTTIVVGGIVGAAIGVVIDVAGVLLDPPPNY
jgi:hypothetical protein